MSLYRIQPIMEELTMRLILKAFYLSNFQDFPSFVDKILNNFQLLYQYGSTLLMR